MSLADLEARLDKVTTELLPELRATKVLNASAFMDLLSLGDELARRRDDFENLPRVLVGKLWFVFTAMLTEADHARDREPILNAAWDYQERLRRFFGPTF